MTQLHFFVTHEILGVNLENTQTSIHVWSETLFIKCLLLALVLTEIVSLDSKSTCSEFDLKSEVMALTSEELNEMMATTLMEMAVQVCVKLKLDTNEKEPCDTK